MWWTWRVARPVRALLRMATLGRRQPGLEPRRPFTTVRSTDRAGDWSRVRLVERGAVGKDHPVVIKASDLADEGGPFPHGAEPLEEMDGRPPRISPHHSRAGLTSAFDYSLDESRPVTGVLSVCPDCHPAETHRADTGTRWARVGHERHDTHVVASCINREQMTRQRVRVPRYRSGGQPRNQLSQGLRLQPAPPPHHHVGVEPRELLR